MSTDYRVKGRSNSECRELAKKLRSFYSANHTRVDVIACLRSRFIWTERGIQELNFQVRPDVEMGADDAVTSYGKGIVTIAVKQSVYDNAFVGDGRARHTLAHELGHGVMHSGVQVQMSRRAGAAGNLIPKWLKPFESAEHQAKVFAAAFLIDDTIASTLEGPEEIAIQFGVSLDSARIYFNEIIESRNREKSAVNIRRLADEYLALTTPPLDKPRYIDELCPSCGKATVFPIGIKFMCDTCHTVVDRFQDGDSVS
jgi:hypothetical protein